MRPCSSRTWSIAPAAPRMPQRIFAPSNAGPAAVEQAMRRPPEVSAISPFVPMSMSRTVPLSWSKRVESRHPTVSAPTKPAMFGRIRTVPSGEMGSSPFAGRTSASKTFGM